MVLVFFRKKKESQGFGDEPQGQTTGMSLPHTIFIFLLWVKLSLSDMMTSN